MTPPLMAAAFQGAPRSAAPDSDTSSRRLISFMASCCLPGHPRGIGGEPWLRPHLIVRGSRGSCSAAGVHKRGNPLPSERQLVDEFGMASATVRRALAKPIEEGTICTVFGIGNFVGPPPEDV
ncbi:GntR family transcriptional regulator [Nonomuraea longispora]|uniref:GntR family transcriptional regulator n=2 Tax=Nonomuraea longispora TaxID=1848320 RepID=A0A4R4MX45_9ACTN|nr:GntR family transcriptional regulator [Nonomuraea longispora]